MVYVRNVRDDAQQGTSLVKVMVAVRNIVAGTPGSEASIQPREVPRKIVVPGAVSSQTAVAGLVATDQIYAGEQITTNRFAPLAEQGVVGQLKGNLRAIQIPGNADQLLAGTLRADDRVDVVGNIKATGAVELHRPAKVRGDITSPSLSIEKGVVFEGRSKMESLEGSNVVNLRAAADEA
jgi:Flp pilus assembly protein CpaB